MVIKDGFCLCGIFLGSRIQLLWHFLSTLNKQGDHVLAQCVSSQHVCVVSGASAGPRLDDGRLYRFSYTTELGVNRPKGSSRGNAGFKISSHVDISLSWRNPENPDEQLLRLQVRRTQHTCYTGSHPTSIVPDENVPVVACVVSSTTSPLTPFPLS